MPLQTVHHHDCRRGRMFFGKGTKVCMWQHVATIVCCLLLGTFPVLVQSQGDNVGALIGFTLIDATKNQPLRPLAATMDVIDLAVDLPDGAATELNIRADAVMGSNIGSVRFAMNGNPNVRTENEAPYALGGDVNSNYRAVPALKETQTHTIIATPWSGRGATGTSGMPLSLELLVIDTREDSEEEEEEEEKDKDEDPPLTPPNPVATDVPAYNHSPDGALTGELRTWHKITLGFDGPETFETASPNPFTEYALQVEFTNGDHFFNVPGYFAADGNAANTGAARGNVWLVHFSPNAVGEWTWNARFTRGRNNAQAGGVGGEGAGFMNGKSGSFVVQRTNKQQGRDLRGKGRLQYVGKHHLQFAERGEYFLKVGADSPENFLAYNDFDNTWENNHRSPLKTWAPHAQDYREGDPTWAGGKGTEIIGAVNYLADMGMNAFSFLTMNIQGDDRKVYPYISDAAENDRLRMDVSKLAQWEVVLEHATQRGMYLHFKTQETENDQLLDGGNLGPQRKLYYRELVARFGHHLALNWNIGEENTNTLHQRIAFANYFREVDPYRHSTVLHTFPAQKQEVYTPLLGKSSYTGISVQTNPNNVFADTLEWVQRSTAAGHPWVVANDEQGSAGTGVLPDDDDWDHDPIRKGVLWGNFMAGGAGVEYYFGYQFPNSDLSCQDFRSRDNMWRLSKVALDFFTKFKVPFWSMSSQNDKLTGGAQWLLANDDVKVIYWKGSSNGFPKWIDLPINTTFRVDWYDSRNGGALQKGSLTQLQGGPKTEYGQPPQNPELDWAVLIRRRGGGGGDNIFEKCRERRRDVFLAGPKSNPKERPCKWLQSASKGRVRRARHCRPRRDAYRKCPVTCAACERFT